MVQTLHANLSNTCCRCSTLWFCTEGQQIGPQDELYAACSKMIIPSLKAFETCLVCSCALRFNLQIRMEVNHKRGQFYVIEQPSTSLLWRYKCIKACWNILLVTCDFPFGTLSFIVSRIPLGWSADPASETQRFDGDLTIGPVWGPYAEASFLDDAFSCFLSSFNSEEVCHFLSTVLAHWFAMDVGYVICFCVIQVTLAGTHPLIQKLADHNMPISRRWPQILCLF